MNVQQVLLHQAKVNEELAAELEFRVAELRADAMLLQAQAKRLGGFDEMSDETRSGCGGAT